MLTADQLVIFFVILLSVVVHSEVCNWLQDTDGKANWPSSFGSPLFISLFLVYFPRTGALSLHAGLAALTYARLICTHYLLLKFGRNEEGRPSATPLPLPGTHWKLN